MIHFIPRDEGEANGGEKAESRKSGRHMLEMTETRNMEEFKFLVAIALYGFY